MKSQEGKHWDRIQNADMQHPILLTPEGSLADGYHRLAKAILNKDKFIEVKQFKSIEDMSPAKIAAAIEKRANEKLVELDNAQRLL
jgi:hypothetical protein